MFDVDENCLLMFIFKQSRFNHEGFQVRTASRLWKGLQIAPEPSFICLVEIATVDYQ